MIRRLLISCSTIVLGALLAACAGTPPQNASIEAARAAYQAIADDPYVARSGASQLRQSEQALKRAESLLKQDAETEKVEHSAYLANRYAEIAAERGNRARLQEQIATAEKRREQLSLQAESLKAERARSEARQAQTEAQRARAEAERLKSEMEALQATQTPRGMVLTLGDVLFDLDKADLKSAGLRTVERLAQFMEEYPERRVRIEGYTDSTGPDDYNLGLSERRAQAVRDALMQEGIDSSRVEVKGFGEQYPVASNDSASGRQQNRRVEIVISDEEGTINTR